MKRYHALGLTTLLTILPACGSVPKPPEDVARVMELEKTLQTMPLTSEALRDPKTGEKFEALRAELQGLISEDGFNERESAYMAQVNDYHLKSMGTFGLIGLGSLSLGAGFKRYLSRRKKREKNPFKEKGFVRRAIGEAFAILFSYSIGWDPYVFEREYTIKQLEPGEFEIRGSYFYGHAMGDSTGPIRPFRVSSSNFGDVMSAIEENSRNAYRVRRGLMRSLQWCLEKTYIDGDVPEEHRNPKPSKK